MSDAIGPGSAVISVDPGRVPVGTVAFVLEVFPPERKSCTRCGFFGLAGLRLSIPHQPDKIGWCINHWRPYQGPEQASRLTSEPTPADREGVMV